MTNTEWNPTPEQTKIFQAAYELGLERNVSKACERSGISRSNFYYWYNHENEFKNAWDNLWKVELNTELPGTIKSIIKQAHAGDMVAAKLHTQLAGILTEKKEQKVSGSIETNSSSSQIIFDWVTYAKENPEDFEIVAKCQEIMENMPEKYIRNK